MASAKKTAVAMIKMPSDITITSDCFLRPSEFHENRQVDAVLNLLEVRRPQAAIRAAIPGNRGSAVIAHE
jgi:hypothetical protein